jgi:hypothetical protein
MKIIAVPEEKTCRDCMYYGECNSSYYIKIIDGKEINCSNGFIFKEEKEVNKQPKLKSGMIVRVKFENALYLYVREGKCFNFDNYSYCSNLDNLEIIEIYEQTSNCGFIDLEKNIELIWPKKSDNDIKIEELQKTIDNMDQEHIKRSEELRRQIEGLKA